MSINEILDYLCSKPVTIAFHDDADGVYSAALVSTAIKVIDAVSPSNFGNYIYMVDEETGKNTYVDLGLDLGMPLDKDFHGIVIDHHPPEMPEKDRQFNLIWNNIPTTGIVYELLKDKIPDEHKWKVVGGLLGDGQVALTPDEIWDNNTFLFERRSSIYKSRYNKISEYAYPVYKLLSSPVNAMCRLGSAVEALNIVLRAKSPLDILTNKAMESDMELIGNDENEVWGKKGLRAIQINRDISIVKIDSKYKQASRVASKLRAMNGNITWIIINSQTKHISLRGELAKYVANKLSSYGIKVGGHSGYCGGSLEKDQSTRDVIEILRKTVSW